MLPQNTIDLLFYCPEDYETSSKHWPVLINFHGGGFTIGRPTDDARWAGAVVEYAEAVVVCVGYRLAPEHPFPTAIDDGVDAALYLIDHAQQLRLDPYRIAFSGFSAGGNMAFSVPIRLGEEYRVRRLDATGAADHAGKNAGGPELLQEGKVVAVAAWYPSLDFTTPRGERRSSNVRIEKELPKFFTDLFDASYLYPAEDLDLASPWLSPGIAPDRLIKALPKNIILYTCEWDGLLAEAERFYDRLCRDFPEKRVVYKKMIGVVHGFDRSPNPIHWDPRTEAMYKDVCLELRSVFYDKAGEEGKREDLVFTNPPVAI